MTRAPLDLRIHDASISIWQDNAQDETLRSEVFAPLIRGMRARGWHVRGDPHIKKQYPVLSPFHRLAERGNMRASIELAGRSIKVEFWADTWPLDNRNGRRYDFNKLPRMEYLDRLRLQLETRRIIAWLETIAPIAVKTDERAGLTAMEMIERRYAESRHSDKKLGRPICTSAYNCKSNDGQTIEHGATVWFIDHGGRISRGTAYYNINNMWWVVADKHTLRNVACFEILCSAPADLHTKHNERRRRKRLEEELALAVRRMNYRRAEVLKGIIFGAEPVFMIWAKDHSAYYRPNYSGYTTDTISAGRYTRAEASAEVRRVPHELVAIGPDGERISAADFERMAA